MRLLTMERFERDEKDREIAAALRVSDSPVQRWRRARRERGEAEVLSKVFAWPPEARKPPPAHFKVPRGQGVDQEAGSLGSYGRA
ncbi:hypothetical protein ACNPQM_42720 [Streptomyces sp. NPDC056231]|uniref:hypothetical protein n=1 Tax=Streptomyces sp. NPDC056231 TaxID=3345755 RepID=UPI003AABD2AF